MNRRITSIGVVLRKDFMSLWPVTIVAVSLPVAAPWMSPNSGMLLSLALLASVLHAFLIVQNDASASVRHDWLTRPIRRLDMILAKAVFVLSTFGAPWLAGFLIHGAPYESIFGRPEPAELGMIAFGLAPQAALVVPLLALAALAGNRIQSVLIVVSLVGAIAASAILSEQTAGTRAIVNWALDWPMQWLLIAGLGAASLVVLWLQYWKRQTLTARIVAALAVGLLVVWPSLPRGLLVAERYEAEALPEIALVGSEACLIDVVPRSRALLSAGEVQGDTFAQVLASAGNWPDNVREAALDEAGEHPAAIVVSGRLDGLPDGWTVQVDRLDASLAGASPAVLRGSRVLTADPGGPVASRLLAYNEMASSWLVPEKAKSIAANGSLNLDVRLTVMKPKVVHRLPADGRRHLVPGIGYCGLELRQGSTRVACTGAWPAPAQFRAHVASRPMSCKVNCEADDGSYAPAWAQLPQLRTYDNWVWGSRGLEDVVITLDEPAARILRRVTIAGPLAACHTSSGEEPPTQQPAPTGRDL